MKSHILFRRNPIFSDCPSCKKLNTLRRSRNRGWHEFILNHFSYFKTYRCKECGWRGFLSTITITAASIKNLVLYLLLGIAAALIVREVLKRFV